MTLVQDGEVAHRGLAELGIKPLVIQDSAPVHKPLTADQEAEVAYHKMAADIGSAWQSPTLARPKARAQGGPATARDLWADGHHPRTVDQPPAALPQAQGDADQAGQ